MPGIHIDLKDLELRKCPSCQGIEYYPVYNLRRCSAIQSPVGKAGLVFIQLGFECTTCGQTVDLNEQPKEKPNISLVEKEP